MKRHFFLAALALLLFVPGLRAQTSARAVQNRLLLIFDTSSDMKRRLPAEEKAVEQLSYTLFGQFQAGNGVGVWTFSHNLRTGEYPLEQWDSDRMPDIESNIMTFVKSQRYSKTTSFDDIPPVLDEVVRHSERLTVLIFCDGDGKIIGTPNDATINSVFRKNSVMMKKARQPFVVVLRSQLGRFVGCTVNSADDIRLPAFPPLPAPPQPVVVPRPKPTPPPPAPPPLVIIGTHVGTNVPPPTPAPVVPAKPVPPPVAPKAQIPASPQIHEPQAERSPAPAASPPESGEMSSAGLNHPPLDRGTNQIANANPEPGMNPAEPTAATNPVVQTTAPLPPASTAEVSPQPPVQSTSELASNSHNNQGLSKAAWFAIGAGVVLIVGVLVFVIMRLFRRRESPSLITESLKKN